ncbi:hypothetical protein [Shewanella pneumatophori]|uniref:Abasic site processing protein n=1 Tax=Shewanella pneumatophori TaxID=314092 RepID=A0A9X1ZAG6_9GAMM|nr:hypothetical protein [Shewanella pneumatophori]MCL1138023.1 hypothetical protein [Shewanella pneumatophori]
MCGRLNIIDDMFVQALMEDLRIKNQQVEMFDDLLKPALRHDFTVQQINKPSQYQPIGQTARLIPNDYYS